MREEYEFTVLEKHASLLFSPEEGRPGTLARKIKIFSDDSRFSEIGRINKEMLMRSGERFFYSWRVVRNYKKTELNDASRFHLLIAPGAYFEPSGEELGTIYEEQSACQFCGAGAKQMSPLRLSLPKSIEKTKHIAKTMAGEIVVSQFFVDICFKAGVTGVAFPKILRVGGAANSLDWYQLMPTAAVAEMVFPTRAGIDPFDEDNRSECRCSNGDTIGLNLLSEIFLKTIESDWSDFVASRQFVGHRMGLLRPERQIIVSQRMRQLLSEAGIQGYWLEIVRQADPIQYTGIGSMVE